MSKRQVFLLYGLDELDEFFVACGENPFMLLLFDVFLLAVDETIEHRPFLGNTEIVLNISDCYVIALGRDAKENAR